MLLYHVFFRDAPGWSTCKVPTFGFLWYIQFLRVAPNAEIHWSCPPCGHQLVKIKVGATQLTQLLGKYVAIYYHLRLPGWTNLHLFMLKPHVSWWIPRRLVPSFLVTLPATFDYRVFPKTSHDSPWSSHDFPSKKTHQDHQKKHLTHDVPMIFLWFSHDFPWLSMIFPDYPWLSKIFPWFSHDFPMILSLPENSSPVRGTARPPASAPGSPAPAPAPAAAQTRRRHRGRPWLPWPGPELERALRVDGKFGNSIGEFQKKKSRKNNRKKTMFLDFFSWIFLSDGIVRESQIPFRKVMGIWTGKRWIFSPCDMSVLPSPPQNGDDFAGTNDMIWPLGKLNISGEIDPFQSKNLEIPPIKHNKTFKTWEMWKWT